MVLILNTKRCKTIIKFEKMQSIRMDFIFFKNHFYAPEIEDQVAYSICPVFHSVNL